VFVCCARALSQRVFVANEQNSPDPDVIVIPRDPPPETEAAPADETPDYLFRIQLAFTSFFAANGKYMGWLAAAGLVGVLVWGLASVWMERSADANFGAIAAIDYRMPTPDPMSVYGIAPADDPNDAGRKSDLQEGARRFEAAAKSASGSAAAYAYLKAADAWQRAGDTDARLGALKAGYEVGGGDLPLWSNGAAYAAALIDAGRAEDALLVYRSVAGNTQGFYAQQALLSLASAQIDLDKKDDAKATILEFRTRFPNASVERAATLETKAGGVAPAPSAPASAAPATPDAPAPPAGSAG